MRNQSQSESEVAQALLARCLELAAEMREIEAKVVRLINEGAESKSAALPASPRFSAADAAPAAMSWHRRS
jgi:hypothetical protein